MMYEYDDSFLNRSDGIVSWKNKKLKFGDAFAAICYAHGISWNQILEKFPEMGQLGKNESTPYTLQDQLEFVQKNKKKTPKKILEIGCGRGEVTCFLSELGYEVISIDPNLSTKDWVEKTSEYFFNKNLKYKLLIGPLGNFTDSDDIKDVDTVLMVETLEHILAAEFQPFYNRMVNILKETKGTFVVTNWIDYHPLAVGQHAPPEMHCRLINDSLYDKIGLDFVDCFYRNGSHLCVTNSKF